MRETSVNQAGAERADSVRTAAGRSSKAGRAGRRTEQARTGAISSASVGDVARAANVAERRHDAPAGFTAKGILEYSCPMQHARSHGDHHLFLRRIARRSMLEHHLAPDFTAAALAELERLAPPASAGLRDLRDLAWCSIDNDESMDLDQLTVAVDDSGGATRILVAIADVDGTVSKDSAIDGHARHNTTSVYTPAEIFPMLPNRLSTDLTSLAFDSDRAAVVVDLVVSQSGEIDGSEIYPALVRNRAKLAYNSVAEWLNGAAPAPAALSAAPGMEEQLRVQDAVASRLGAVRISHGALEFETIEAKPVFDDGAVCALHVERRNRAKAIIENFMIAANTATARYLASRNLPSLRRVVRSPSRWGRIVDLAARHGRALPAEPDGQALQRFLVHERAAEPEMFPDLSLAVIKLMGAGEYVVERPGEREDGHFGLAVRAYSHSTAPNRRFPDLVTQRLLKASMCAGAVPYGEDELEVLASHCTAMEDEANKVERTVKKAAAALLLERRVGQEFSAVVTGAAPKGTWVRLLDPPVEGRLEHGFEGVDVGDQVRVRLVSTDAERGFIDFARV
jgi:VacB/RNase II family 3'-5' exoribonuclease